MQLSKDLFVKLQSSVDFFKSFTAGELIALLKLAQTEIFENEIVVFKEGTIGEKMYIILSGKVRISRPIGKGKEEVLVVLEAGACFGEMAVVDKSPRSARATAQGQTVLLSLNERVLSEHNLLLAYKLFRNFAAIMADRLRSTNEKLQKATEGDRTSSDQVKTLLKKKLEAGVSMERANFKGANLSEVFMNSANFKNSVLVGANLSGAKCKQTNFQNSKLTSAQFNNCNFEQAIMDKADFTGAVFKNCNFNGCNIQGASFLGADLTESQLENLERAGADMS